MKYLHGVLALSIVAGNSWIRGSEKETFEQFKKKYANKNNEELLHLLFVKDKVFRKKEAEQKAAVAASRAEETANSADKQLGRVQRALRPKLGGRHPLARTPRILEQDLKRAAHQAGSNSGSDAGPSAGGSGSGGSNAGSEASVVVRRDIPEKDRLIDVYEELSAPTQPLPDGCEYFQGRTLRTEKSLTLQKINDMTPAEMRSLLAKLVIHLTPETTPAAKLVNFSETEDVREIDGEPEFDAKESEQQTTTVDAEGESDNEGDGDGEIVFTPNIPGTVQPTQAQEASDSDEENEQQTDAESKRSAARRQRSVSEPADPTTHLSPELAKAFATLQEKNRQRALASRQALQAGVNLTLPVPATRPNASSPQPVTPNKDPNSMLEANKRFIEMVAAARRRRSQSDPAGSAAAAAQAKTQSRMENVRLMAQVSLDQVPSVVPTASPSRARRLAMTPQQVRAAQKPQRRSLDPQDAKQNGAK